MIKELDPTLLFNILVVAEGFKPQFAKKVDPLTGPLNVTLEPVPPEPPHPRAMFFGRVLDPEGQLVVGAVVTIHMYYMANGGSTRAPEGSDPLGITNGRGEFRIRHTEPLDRVDVMVEARGLAPKIFKDLPVEGRPHELRMIRGASVSGRVVRNGEPVPGVAIGLVQTDRSLGKFVGEFVIGTDEQGRFLLSNVTPGFEYVVYGKMSSLQGLGAVPVRKIAVVKDEEVVKVGDLEVLPGHRLRGQVRLSDGGEIPAGTRVAIGRQDAWDTLLVELDGAGRFAASDLPSEVLHLTVRVRGYHYSQQNLSLHPMNRHLEGRADRDIDGLVILLEPGEEKPPWDDPQQMRKLWEQAEQLPELPLRGAEPGP